MNIKTLGLAVATVAILASNILPAHAGRDGVPGRRIGGGSRWVPVQVQPAGDTDTLDEVNELQDAVTGETRSRRRNRVPK